jgi:hypothetical protein
MKPKRLAPSVAALLIVGPLTTTNAHHSFAAVYDGSRTVTLDGTITEFHFVNPHALATVEVADAKGAVQRWTVEFDGRLNLTNAGWRETTIQTGTRVKISGSPERNGGQRIFFSKLVRADGTELLRPAIDRVSAIEEERRQRAAQRAASGDAK